MNDSTRAAACGAEGHAFVSLLSARAGPAGDCGVGHSGGRVEVQTASDPAAIAGACCDEDDEEKQDGRVRLLVLPLSGTG